MRAGSLDDEVVRGTSLSHDIHDAAGQEHPVSLLTSDFFEDSVLDQCVDDPSGGGWRDLGVGGGLLDAKGWASEQAVNDCMTLTERPAW